MGRYEGSLAATWNLDGRSMQLTDQFAFIDCRELRWAVPGGARIDGASIPQFLWSITGSPYTGKYRDASVVHDFYCSVRSRPSDATHRMFHEAMIVSGVSSQRAAVMYAAVKYAGPRWSSQDMHNVNLATGGQFGWERDNVFHTDGGNDGGIACGTVDGASDSGDGGYPGGGDSGGGGYGGYDGWDVQIPACEGVAQAWAPASVSAEEFLGLADQIRAGELGLAEIEVEVQARLNDRPAVASTSLPNGVFPFESDQSSAF